MKLAIVTPLSIRYIANGDLTVREDETIKSWLTQWTVPNNHAASLVDLDALKTDPMVKIAEDFMQIYRSVVRGKPDEDAVHQSFKYSIRVLHITPGAEFWPSDGRTFDVSLKQMLLGFASVLNQGGR